MGFSPPKVWGFNSPYSNQGADYAHSITVCPPGSKNLTASLHMNLSHCYLVSFQQYISICVHMYRQVRRFWDTLNLYVSRPTRFICFFMLVRLIKTACLSIRIIFIMQVFVHTFNIETGKFWHSINVCQ